MDDLSTTLPPLIGQRVVLENLNNTAFNGKCGLVLGFSQRKQCFLVKVDECEKSKFLKGCNLYRIFEQSKYCSTMYGKLVDLNLVDPPNVVDGLEICQWFNENRHGDITDFECEVKFQWCYHMLQEIPKEKSEIRSELLGIVKSLLQEASNFPSIQVKAKFLLALADKSLENKASLRDCVQNHYGCLPLIALALFESEIEDCSKENIKLCLDAIKIVKSKNFDFDFNKMKQLFFGRLLNFLIVVSAKFENKRFLFDEIRYLRENLLNGEIHILLYFSIARSYMMEKQFENALVYLKSFLKDTYSTKGADTIEIGLVYIDMLTCYENLGRKRDALKCLKQSKKYLPKRITDKYACGINKMKQKNDRQIDELSFKRTLKVCSYHLCKNAETKTGEFQKCTSCERAYYCTEKCQKLDWKNGHKDTCRLPLECRWEK